MSQDVLCLAAQEPEMCAITPAVMENAPAEKPLACARVARLIWVPLSGCLKGFAGQTKVLRQDARAE